MYRTPLHHFGMCNFNLGDDQCIQKGGICLFCSEEEDEEESTTIYNYSMHLQHQLLRPVLPSSHAQTTNHICLSTYYIHISYPSLKFE